ncbi:Cilia- and flagella-associated protein 157 [Channa argus]|uniref:Cilia-and flagella-associated protein 157 n=1 Tax=Channa argus TaxID=215402 RepID=A0A6G1PYW5_CHAAH|nr:Cilia- and flagella-associated protein 157 [Channa argus]
MMTQHLVLVLIAHFVISNPPELASTDVSPELIRNALTRRLLRCQLRCDELEKENKNFVSLKIALEEDKKDITEYLKHTAAALEKQVDELTVLLEKQQETDKQDRELVKQQHSQEIQKLQEQIDKLNIVKTTLGTTLEEQEEKKEHLMEQIQQLPSMESLEKQFLHQQEEYEAAAQSLMTEAGLEKAKILEMQNEEKKCVEVKISEMLHEVRTQISEETEKIQNLTEETLELLKQKELLQDRESAMCLEEDELRDKLHRVQLEMFTNEKEMEQLKNKYQSLVDNVKNCRIQHECVLAEEDALRLCLASMSEKCYAKTVEADHVRSELREESGRRKKLESSVKKAAATLRHILMGPEKLPVKKMQKLLETLEISVPQATVSETSSQEQDPLTSVPKAERHWIHFPLDYVC